MIAAPPASIKYILGLERAVAVMDELPDELVGLHFLGGKGAMDGPAKLVLVVVAVYPHNTQQRRRVTAIKLK